VRRRRKGVTRLETRSFFSSETEGEGSGGGAKAVALSAGGGKALSAAQPREESRLLVDFTTLVSNPLEATE
jgi:hypothetical protein